MQPRVVKHSYRDPLSEIWVCTAHKIGLKVDRTDDAFVHSDGRGTLSIAKQQYLDEDDSLAQMVFHELCHSLVEGPESFFVEDWGLDNTCEKDYVREHATMRVQAVLAGRYGLRGVFAPTTDFREFYDALGPDPLLGLDEASAALARPAIRRAETNPWWPHMGKALEATATITRIAANWPAPTAAPSLYSLQAQALPVHQTGAFERACGADDTCLSCAWLEQSQCRQAESTVSPDARACERFEPAFDCQSCGACCQAAYHSVTIADGDEVATKHPDLIIVRDEYSEIRRQGDHCAALKQDGGRFHCTIYQDRPTCCREFENAGINCVTARRRLGLSL